MGGGEEEAMGPCWSLKASNEVLEFQTVRSEKAVKGFKWRE